MHLLDRVFWALARLFPAAPSDAPSDMLGGPRGVGRIGAGWVERQPGGRRLPDGGLVPDPAALGHGELPEPIARFYARTTSLDLRMTCRWNPAFRPAARLWEALYPARWAQLELPAFADTSLTNEVWTWGEGSRVWIRRYAGTDRVFFLIQYDVVAVQGAPHIRLTFPVPGGAWAVVLRIERHGDRLVLTEAGGAPGGPGLYLLPTGGTPRYVRALREEITLSAVGGALHAVHTFDWWGIRFLTLTYDAPTSGTGSA